MKLPRLNFTSYRDRKGYRLIGKEPPPKGKFDLKQFLAKRPDQITSGRLEEGYDWEEMMPRYGKWISGYIVGNGGKSMPLDLNQYPHAFEEYAKIKTPDELTAFITKFGPLTRDKRQVAIDLLDQARQMREYMRAKKVSPVLRTLTALLYNDPKSGQLEIQVTPTSLLDALWLQLEHAQSSDAVFKTCPYCKTPFAAGGNSGRLRNAEFCSPEHRKRFNSLARSNPALKEKRK